MDRDLVTRTDCADTTQKVDASLTTRGRNADYSGWTDCSTGSASNSSQEFNVQHPDQSRFTLNGSGSIPTGKISCEMILRLLVLAAVLNFIIIIITIII